MESTANSKPRDAMLNREPLTCTHDPFPVIANPDTLAGFFELEILQQFNAICVFGIGLQASLALSGKPFW